MTFGQRLSRRDLAWQVWANTGRNGTAARVAFLRVILNPEAQARSICGSFGTVRLTFGQHLWREI